MKLFSFPYVSNVDDFEAIRKSFCAACRNRKKISFEYFGNGSLDLHNMTLWKHPISFEMRFHYSIVLTHLRRSNVRLLYNLLKPLLPVRSSENITSKILLQIYSTFAGMQYVKLYCCIWTIQGRSVPVTALFTSISAAMNDYSGRKSVTRIVDNYYKVLSNDASDLTTFLFVSFRCI